MTDETTRRPRSLAGGGQELDLFGETVLTEAERKKLAQKRAMNKWRAKHPLIALLAAIKHRALTNDMSFDLTLKWADTRWTGRCELTGLEFVRPARRAGMFAPSIDRIDNTKGYTQDNCRIVLWAVNRFKNNDTDETMLTIARALVAKADATSNGD